MIYYHRKLMRMVVITVKLLVWHKGYVKTIT